MKKAVIIVSVFLIVGGGFGNYLRYIEQTPDRPANFDNIPFELDGFVGAEERFAEDSYDILKADTTTLRHYVDSLDYQYWLFIAYFSSQKYGSQIHSPKHCLPGGGWKIISLEPYELKLENAPVKNINRLLIAERDRKQLMLYWFETRGGTIRNEFALKGDLVVNSLLLHPTDAAIVRLTLPLAPGEDFDAATERAVAFFNAFRGAIDKALPF
ncbi:MAG: EpsI family protein [candidate division Zixibacteria bacterium]|nr:EpsI family protein [candidate division Zixibacteria bacterium]